MSTSEPVSKLHMKFASVWSAASAGEDFPEATQTEIRTFVSTLGEYRLLDLPREDVGPFS